MIGRTFSLSRSLRFIAVPLLLLGGCSKEAVRQSSSSEPVLSRQYRQESATVIISVSETNIPTSGEIRLMVDVHAPPDIAIVFPDIDDSIEPYSIADGYAEPIQTLPNGKHLHRRVWMLVPSLPGEAVFRPIEISVGSATVKTDPIAVEAISLLPGGLDTFEIKDIAESATLLPEAEEKRQRRFILTGFAVAVVFLFFVIKRLCRPKKIKVPAPHETAFQALQNLPEEELEKVHALTEVLLAFIDGRFKLPTSARTVNEILPLLPAVILPEHHEPLRNFLIDSERIRFSNKVPAGFADALESYVCSFVGELKEVSCD